MSEQIRGIMSTEEQNPAILSNRAHGTSIHLGTSRSHCELSAHVEGEGGPCSHQRPFAVQIPADGAGQRMVGT